MIKRIYKYFYKKFLSDNYEPKNIEKRMIDALEKFSPPQNSNRSSDNLYHYILTKVDELNNYKYILDYGSGLLMNTYKLTKNSNIKKVFCYDPIYKNPKLQILAKKIINKNKKLIFSMNYKNDLKKVDLFFCNLVFSHLSVKEIKELLKNIYANKCDIIFSANSNIDQRSEKLTKYDPKKKLYQHNYLKILKSTKFTVKWIYQLDHQILTDKKIVLCFAQPSV